MNRPLVCLLAVLPVLEIRADDQVRSTQEELRRRNIYFGNVDGRRSTELEEALKRYQKRKGLSPTGEEDHDTLRSLGLASRAPGEPPPKDLEWPEEPVLKSDAKINVAAAAREIAASSGVAMASVAPGEKLSAAEPISAGERGRRASSRPRLTTRGSEPSPVKSPDRPTASSVSFTTVPGPRLQSQLADYVRDYLKATSRNRLEDELHFYADKVDYLGNGVVDRRIIEQSLRNYYRRWPSRSYSAPEQLSYRTAPGRGEIVVRFQTKFSLKNGGPRVRGTTENEMVISAATADPRIVSIKEQRVRR
jgi:peptidoglycan hydrolase-like protein with peptidoglycan-binding domain